MRCFTVHLYSTIWSCQVAENKVKISLAIYEVKCHMNTKQNVWEEKDSATLYSKLKDWKCDKIMHFEETAQISFLTKLPWWWWFESSKIWPCGWEFRNIFKELGAFTFRIWWSKNNCAKWQAVLYRCGCSKDKVSGKSLWGGSDMNRVR